MSRRKGSRPNENSADDEIFRSEAVVLLAPLVGGIERAGEVIEDALRADRLPWSYVENGKRVNGKPGFWSRCNDLIFWGRDGNSAEGYGLPCIPVEIKVSQRHVLALRPGAEAEATQEKDGWAVKRAKELMEIAYPNGKWRTMGPRAVRKGCEAEAKAKQLALPSVDSFARAMGRRKKPK